MWSKDEDVLATGLGECPIGGEGAADRCASYSDHGAGVERLIASVDGEDTREPDWVYGVRIERAKLGGVERRIATALANGKSRHAIQRELRLDRTSFREKMKNLQTRFRPYYKGLCEWRASHPLSLF